MKRREQVLLSFYVKFHGRTPTVMEAFARQPAVYWLGMAVLLAIPMFATAWWEFAQLQLPFGIVAGAMLRDIGLMLRFKRDWPILDRALNWSEIDRRLSQQSVRPSAD